MGWTLVQRDKRNDPWLVVGKLHLRVDSITAFWQDDMHVVIAVVGAGAPVRVDETQLPIEMLRSALGFEG